MTTEKLYVTIDKVQKPQHFWKIKKSPRPNSETLKRGHVWGNLDVW